MKTAYDIRLNGYWITTLYTAAAPDEIREKLINQHGYNPAITVTKAQ